MATAFTANQQTVSSFYLSYYGRPADPAGLAYWAAQLDKAGGNLDSIVSSFASSAESTARFSDLTPAQHITSLYQELLGRPPEAAGAAYWLGEVTAGRMTIAQLAINVYAGAQGVDVTTVDVRQALADQFTAALPADGAGYTGLVAVEAARLVIQAANATTSAADVATLANAGVKLAASATANPAVITALTGANGSLTDLLGTAAGKADPLALVNLVNTIVTAAAGNAASLTTLLGTGTLTDVITTLPAGTTLTGLDTAITDGGLAGGGAVVNPPEAPPADGGGGDIPPPAKSVAYSAVKFTEAGANDGSITEKITITLTGDTFTGADGVALGTVTNVPVGLTAVLVKASATTATLSFTGNATAHANAQDISNLTVTFANGDFTGANAAAVTGAVTNNLVVDFADPAPATPTALATITTVTDNVGTITGPLTTAGVTDDTTLDLSGAFTGTLAAGEVIAIYNGAIKLGEATATGTTNGTWTYTTTALAQGAVSLTAVAENGAVKGTASTAFTTTVDTTAPVVTDAHISITSMGTGTGTAYKAGDTVTVSWSNAAGADNNTDLQTVTADFSALGGGGAVVMTTADSGATYTGSYLVPAVPVALSGKTVSVTATDKAGNVTTRADSTILALQADAPSGFTVTDSTPTGMWIVGTAHGNVAVTDDGTNYVFTPTTGVPVNVPKTSVTLGITVNTITLTADASILNGMTTVIGNGSVTVTGPITGNVLLLNVQPNITFSGSALSINEAGSVVVNASSVTGDTLAITGVSGGLTETLQVQGTAGDDAINLAAFTTTNSAVTVNGLGGADTITLSATAVEHVIFLASADGGSTGDTINSFDTANDVLFFKKTDFGGSGVNLSAAGGMAVAVNGSSGSNADLANLDPQFNGVIRISDNADGTFSDVVAIANAAITGTNNSIKAILLIDNGVSTRAYFWNDGVTTANSTIEAGELTLMGTLMSVTDATAVTAFSFG